MSTLEVEGLTYTYAGSGGPALTDLSFEIAEGEWCLLAGASASGKSTVVRAACGLVPHFHGGTFAGRVRAAGLDTREHGPDRLSAAVGTLLQDPETQIVMGRVRAELAFPLENRGLGPAAVARGVEEVALALGLERILDRDTASLSGGERQRVALGAALGGRPSLLVLDEPTSQLDPVAGDELIGLLRRLNEEWGTTVLLAEHRLERCLSAADRAIALRGGALGYDGDPSGFLRWAAEEEQTLLPAAARLFGAAGIEPLPVGVKHARRTLRDRGLDCSPAGPSGGVELSGALSRRGSRRPPPGGHAVALSGVWHELRDGPAILRGIELTIAPGERVALMGRNGAGKSTLLRHLRGLVEPTRGRIRVAGRVALLLQNPGDYLLGERVADEAGPDVLEAAGLAHLATRHPRDLSGGERQRLALAIVTAPEPGGGTPPAVVALDEPTRGMDRAAKELLVADLRGWAARGAATVVATHDVEFAAAFAERVVLMGEGTVIADGPVAEVLSGGWYFATEIARVLGGAALGVQDGLEALRARIGLEVA